LDPQPITYRDLADPIHDLWITPLSRAERCKYAPELRTQADAFILRWLDDPGLDLVHVRPEVKLTAKNRLLAVHREFADNLGPIPPALWPLGPTGAARALLRMRIQLESSSADAKRTD